MTTTNLAAKVKVEIVATYKDVLTDKLANPVDPLIYEILSTLTNGKGLDKAENLWTYKFEASDAGTTIDVFGGGTPVFKNFRGDVLSMDQIKMVLVRNLSLATGEYIIVGNSAECIEMFNVVAEAMNEGITIFPGGFNLYYAPGGPADCPSPEAGDRDELKITAAPGKTPMVEVILIGENNGS